VKRTQFWGDLVSLPRLRRRDEATISAIEGANADAAIVCIAQTRESREALASYGAGFSLGWAGVLGVSREGISLWQCPRDSNSRQIFNTPWNDVSDLRLATVPVWNYTIRSLQLTFETGDETRVVAPFIVRKGIGSFIGLGSGRRIDAVAAKVIGFRDKR
jgi:hypothetical protein